MASYSTEFKKKVVKEYKTTDKSISDVAEEFDVNQSSVSNWHRDDRFQPDENNVTDSNDESDSLQPSGGLESQPDDGKADTKEDEENEPEISDSSDDSGESSDSNAGVIVDKVQPQEQDTRKNKDESGPESEDENDGWMELDYNSGKQVKTILETTDLSEPRQAQKLLKAFKTGEADDIPQFDEIRVSDGELR